ncbi:MAG: 3-dehydroquinate synthase [Bacteroidetes bacterium]|nr:MAG: 3-dehydroquinate synthase [Bacteroidota bacterium]
MKKLSYKFSAGKTDFYFDLNINALSKLVSKKEAVIITDENVFRSHKLKFKGWNTIVLKPGEEFKIQATVDSIIEQLIGFEATRKTFLIGVGGGVVTDITGYVASIYMRGLSFGFVPTTLLAMVDASIGGKNGIDVNVYKNMVGTIRQPHFLLYDISLLKSLPESEWKNGMAEIIKHACIKDGAMFRLLEENDLNKIQTNKKLLADIVERNAKLKTRVVQVDEFEKGDRKLLNFGHTLGHAIENQYELSHGQAISIGMGFASLISSEMLGFKDAVKVMRLLNQYGLPTSARFDSKKVFDVLKMDKKRVGNEISYILLEKIGKATIRPIPIKTLERIISKINK